MVVISTRTSDIIDIRIVMVTRCTNTGNTNKVIVSNFHTAAKKIQLQVKYHSDVFCSNNKNIGKS